jgi:uncharacterized protein
MMSSLTHLPERLDVRRFAQESAQLEGRIALSKMERLAQDLYRPLADLTAEILHWQARGEQVEQAGGAAQIWLHVALQTTAPMQCQRCLSEVAVALQVQRSFRFVRSEEEAMAQDDDAQEDLLVLSKQLDLLELIEDEAIMALPMVPTHERCPQPVKLASSDQEFKAALAAKPNAFAALGELKKKTGDQR